MFHLTCLMVSGGFLNQDLSEAIYRKACKMFFVNERKAVVKSDSFEFTISTDFTRASLGCLRGYIYTAQVEREGRAGTITVKFLLDPPEPEVLENAELLMIPLSPQAQETSWLN